MTKIVSVHSFRGGTGKSNLTANLATLLALDGYRVGVIDTDIQSPGIHILFGLEEDHIHKTLNDYLRDSSQCQIKDTAYDCTEGISAALAGDQQCAGSMFLIPSSIKTDDIVDILSEGYDVDLLSDGLRQLNEDLNLDYLMIDTHPGLNEETLISIGLSDVAVIILRPDHQDYQGTAVTVEVAKELDVEKMFLVVNKVLPEFDFDALKEQLRQTYNAEVATILPMCHEMMLLASEKIFCLEYPDHDFTENLHKILDTIKQ